MGERDLPATARVLDDAAPTWQLRTRDPKDVLAALAEAGVHHVWLEGGPTVAAALMARRPRRRDHRLRRARPAGRGRPSVSDLGITSIDHALRLKPTDITLIGNDVRITASPEGDRLMFTGIVEELGHVVALEPRCRLRPPHRARAARHLRRGSRCVHRRQRRLPHGRGARRRRFTVDVMAETLDRSSLGSLGAGDRVNLERAMAASSRFGGHIVQGHVDGTAEILSRTPGDRWEVVQLSLPADALPLRRGEGVDHRRRRQPHGVRPHDTTFSVSLIPTTLALTTLGHKGVGDLVNLEVDVLAKYVERLITSKETIA